MNSAPRRGPYSILFDWGTTNLRAYLIDDSGRMADCYAAKLGVKHVSRDEYLRSSGKSPANGSSTTLSRRSF